MKRASLLWPCHVAALLVFSMSTAGFAQSAVRISEFMASNRGTLADGNGDYSDWIELQNGGETAVNLGGWHLTDDATNLRKWTFPSVTLSGGEYLVVFASGLGVPDTQGRLHTNFKLASEGSYLALVQPDGTNVVQAFSPVYPAQRRDFSYGVGQQVVITTFVSNGSPARLLVPNATDAAIGAAWTGGNEPFADTAWLAVPAAIGFEGAPVNSTNTVNVALGKPVIAAGETWSGLPKENLTDGNLSTFTHNLNQERAFSFIVDLGTTYLFSSLELFNRNDSCCPDRLSNYTISIHADTGPEIGSAVWSANIRTNGSNSGVGGRDLVTANLDPAGVFAGRWIKAQARDNGTARYFQIAELRANAPNWAAGATVTASGATLSGMTASNLVDGNLGTFSHNLDLAATFAYQIRLTQAVAFSRIEVLNRNDGCCPDRLTIYRVSVHTDNGGIIGPAVWMADVRTDGSNSGVGGTDVLIGARDPDGLFEGQWIQVQNLDNGTARYLQIAEVRAFGWAGNSGYGTFIRRDVAAEMNGVNASVWLRVPFNASGPFDYLKLRLRYDDGFVAYLNGVEVARRNAPAGVPAWNASALTGHAAGLTSEEFAVPVSRLRTGANVLAIHALNVEAGDRDFLLAPELTGLVLLTGTNGYLTIPTPGQVNSNVTFAGFVGDTQFSVNRGFFDSPFDVTMTCATPGATLVYTTNNSVPTLLNGVVTPTLNSTSGPSATVRIFTTTALRAAAFRAGLLPSDVDTHTYIFLNDVIRQPANPAGLPLTWSGGAADYAMDPKVVTNALYRDEIVGDLRSIPTLSIVLPTADLFGAATGIYFNSEQVGDNWERAVSAEWILPDGSTGFQENCGMRIWGTGWRPNGTTPKHAIQLKFKNQYGAGRLNYPLFSNSAVDEYDNLVLRAQGSRGWTDFRQPDIEQSQYIHDAWARDTGHAMGKLDGHATFAHLYLNGLYWGLYNPVEKTDDGFGEIHYGGDKSEFDVITRRGAPEVDAGTIDAWNQMMTIVNAGLASPEQYALLQQYLDVDDFIDYMMLHQYASNHDGPLSTIANNMRAIRRRAPGAQFRFYVWDMEYTFWYPQEFNLGFDLDQCPARIFQRLRTNPEFRLRWADHAHKHLLNGGALTPVPAAARWQARAEELVGPIVGESARWGDVRRTPPYTRNVEWTNELNRLLYEYFPVRAEILLNQYRLTGLYPKVTPPSFNQPGGDVPLGFNVSVTAPAGAVYYTIDGSDPRNPGGAVAPSAVSFVPTTTLVSTGSVVRMFVPPDDSLGADWKQPVFNDAAWLAGPNAAGFDASVPPSPINVPLQNASADFSEASRAASLAIDGQPLTTGWGIFENQSYLPKGRGAVMVFETVADVGFPEGTRLTFTLRHGVSGQLTLGKFRLAATLDNRTQFADGQSSRGDILANWIPLQPTSATAAGGASITINPDGTLLVGGTSPTTNTYVVTVVTPLLGITGFRLEALEDGSLPSNGPGRAGNGNAVLTDFVVQAAPATLAHLVNGPMSSALQTAMVNVNATTYWRASFNVGPGLSADRLLLRVRYEDGFIAYLNGQEIARRNAPATTAWNSAAAGDRAKGLGLEFEEIDVTASKALLSNGANVLAVQALNSEASSADFQIQAELVARTDRLLPVGDTLTIKARVLSGLEWSALQESTFSARSPLRFTEIMYDPPAGPGLTGDEFEFLEIQNVGAVNYSLGGFTFTSGINFTFTNGTVLAPGQFFLLGRNAAALASRYPGIVVNGIYTGRLDNQGETITLSRPFNGGTVLSITYNNSADWPQTARGFGYSLVPIDPVSGTNLNRGASWRASGAIDGSPGGMDIPADIPRVLVNEILTASTPPQTDLIELFNPTVSPANVGGWFLTDDPRTPKKFRIPNGTIIAPGSFAVFTESDFNTSPGSSNSFSLSSQGESVFLFSGDVNTNLTGYSHGLDFEPAAAGVSFGRYVNSVGEEHFPAQRTLTTNAPNSGPRVGPVVFGEVHYHPGPGGDEFVEVRNISGSAVDLFDPLHPTNTWTINGLGFDFPSGVTLPPNGVALVVGSVPAAFRAKYGVSAQIPVFGPFTGALQDSGERLELKCPDVPDTNGLFYITVDAVRYNDRPPWPILADGFGPSLQRRLASAYGDDPTNWMAAAPSPGTFPSGGTPPVIVSPPASLSVPRHGEATFAVSATGAAPLRYQWRLAGTNVPGATNTMLVLHDVQFHQAGAYSVVVYNPVGSVESAGAILSVFQAATIVAQPQNALVRPGSNAMFSVFATSVQPIAYQWRFNGIDIPGATGPTLLRTNVGLADAGVYTVRVDDGIVSLTSTPASLVLLVNPFITRHPISQTVVTGGNVTLSVSVTNTATLPMGYRWRRGSAQLAFFELNSTNSFFTVTNVQVSANYNVVVTNAAHTTGFLSSQANITVTSDTDGDGLPDDWELANGLNSNDPGDANLDADGDTMITKNEYIAGTDPRDPLSYLKVGPITREVPVALSFSAVSNRTYTIEYTDGVGGGVWTTLAEIAAGPSNRVESVTDRNPGNTRIYRLGTPRVE